MSQPNRSKKRFTGTGPWLIASTLLLAILVAPFAGATGEGEPLEGGQRNPGANETQELTRETEIIANTSSYGTRQSNKSDNGGGAIYGCRSKAGGSAAKNEPCIRANNLADGLAFEYESNGAVVGSIRAKDANAKPFTTNATGVADGLNADRVDSKNAAEIAADAVTITRGGLRFAAVDQAGDSGSRRGVASTKRDSAGLYTVVFENDASTCAITATQVASTDAQFDGGGAVAVRLLEDKKTLRVRTLDQDGALADRSFHVQATCL